MNKLYILVLLFFSVNTFAQIEQISVGAAYTQQAFYDLETGKSINIPNNSWDIAFINNPESLGSIIINESAGSGEIALELFEADSDVWEEVGIDESFYVPENMLSNPELSWKYGAFNSLRDTEDPADYGWGIRETENTDINGTQIFSIKNRSGEFLKLEIVDFVNGIFNFRWAALDGNNEVNASIDLNDFLGEPIVFYSFNTGEAFGIEQDYDLIFQRYFTPLDDGTGQLVDYVVTGTLLAPGTEAVKAIGINPTDVNEADYVDSYVDTVNHIGHDWKYFDFAVGWVIESDRAYFVETKDGNKYKLVFLDFEGSATGITTIEKSALITSNVEEQLISQSIIKIFPNPFAEVLQIQNINDDTVIEVFDLNGKRIVSKRILTDFELDLSNLIPGSYTISINSNSIKFSKLIIKK